MAKKLNVVKIKEIKTREKIKEIDVIVPCHFVDWTYFSGNVASWFKELPIRKLYFGCNNPDPDFIKSIKDYLSQYENAVFIDQRKLKTLGMQIADLMKKVETEWFVYCHTDAKLTPHSFLVMEAEIDVVDPNDDREVGMIESEHINYNGKIWIFPNYHENPRSFSGYQLFRKKAVDDIIQKIEDDYIYRNEDIIFQNACEVAGYRFIKSWQFHIHYATINHMWTPKGIFNENSRKLTFEMQPRGIVKYCTPDVITKKAWRDGFGASLRDNNTDIFEFIKDFVRKENSIWEEAIEDIITQLLKGIYIK